MVLSRLEAVCKTKGYSYEFRPRQIIIEEYIFFSPKFLEIFFLIEFCFKVYDRDTFFFFHSFRVIFILFYDDTIKVRSGQVSCFTIVAVHSVCYQFYNLFRPGKECGSLYTDVNADPKHNIEMESLIFHKCFFTLPTVTSPIRFRFLPFCTRTK